MTKFPESEMSEQPIDETQFRNWLDRLAASRSPRGAEGLEYAREFFALLGNPQNRVRSVHVLGTAGKGTAAHLTTLRLLAAGMSVATHMSPHVHDPRERFLINGVMPPWSLVLAAVPEMVSAVEQTRLHAGRPPSYFAVTAAMACLLGRRSESDVLVIEAGIGGRFDATNVIDRPGRIVVMTAIGLDHVDVLGSSIEEIALEKAAAIDGAACVVLAPQPNQEAARVVTSEAESMGVPIRPVDLSPDEDWRFQADAVAAEVERFITGRAVASATIPKSLPPGRFEVREVAGRRLVLDGAHNAVKLRGLLDTLRRSDAGRVACVVAAVGHSKDLNSCAEAMVEMSPIVIATEFMPDVVGTAPRSWPVDDLANALRRASSDTRIVVSHDPIEVADQAIALSDEGDTIVVTGSFFHLATVADTIASRVS